MRQITIQELYSIFLSSSGISTDSRDIKEGNLFFALKGDNFDGNKFATKAIEKGAIASIVSDASLSGAKFFYADDTLKCLQDLARHHRSKFTGKVIGLTGSNGKTTTKELIVSVLSTQYVAKATVGNLNNHIGVPLTLLRCPVNVDFLVVEMGANHQKEIELLSSICQPDFGLITNIGKAHLEGFGGVEGVKKGKGELYEYLIKNGKVIFLNDNDPILLELLHKISREVGEIHPKVTRYNQEELSTKLLNENPVSFEYRCGTIESSLSGLYNFQNISAALSIGEYFGVTCSNIITAINSYLPNNNRSEWLQIGNTKMFLDAYNANPSSMLLSLKNFIAEIDQCDVYLIIGEMLELGEYSAEEHQKLLKYVASLDVPAILVGEQFQNNAREIKLPNHITTIPKIDDVLNKEFLSNVKNKTVFVKGSRGCKLEKVAKFIQSNLH